MPATTRAACVAIGRNEGDRLLACLRSARRDFDPVIYVDSGSTDGSVRAATELGCEVLELDVSTPFTAARARNAGLDHLRSLRPDVRYVQFVDGDCEIVEGWRDAAVDRLERDDGCAVMCGRRRERYPERSIFNRLCDIEWDTPVGTAEASGGDALMRIEALDEVKGFDPSVIAGEEPELCFRLRERGWTIERIDAEMTLHDAAMTRVTQWWRRMRRSGYAYALGSAMHGTSPERYWRRQTRRILFWGVGFPLAVILLAATVSWWMLVMIPVGYLWSALRVYADTRHRGEGHAAGHSALYALSLAIGRLPEALGVLEYLWVRARGAQRAIIEYK